MPCILLEVNLRFGGTCRLLQAVLLLGLLFDGEDGGDVFLRNSVDFQRTIRRYIPEDRTLYNYCCENFQSDVKIFVLWIILIFSLGTGSIIKYVLKLNKKCRTNVGGLQLDFQPESMHV
jgi:hypothetical protein